MSAEQQEQTLQYFNDHAQQWKAKAAASAATQVNVIQERNRYVLEMIKQRATTDATLDVGCGTGELVCATARLGIDATGVDFAEEMISIARAAAAEEQLDSAHFHCSSVFDFQTSDGSYDVVSANGFIEYISLQELETFIQISRRLLKPKGSLVLGSRNRLFNLVSMNDFTEAEFENGTFADLLQEAVALAEGASLAELQAFDPAPLQAPETEHARTGVDVSTRFQFTPVQLMRILSIGGFRVEQLYPIHIHGVSSAFKAKHPEIHSSISNLLQSFANEDQTLVTYSSSFMIHARTRS